MIDHKSELALAFLQAQPSAAAGVLEQQPIDKVAEFLKSVPYKQAAVVLKKMLPQYTARLCKYLDATTAAAFLSEMDVNLIAAILRHADNNTSNDVLALLPERIKLACNLLLSYPETAIGAWMVTNYISFPDDCSVQDAKQRLFSIGHVVGIATIYIVDRDRQIQGSVNVTKLLRSPSKNSIQSIMDKKIDAVSGRSSLSAVENDPMWQRAECVAVINSSRQIIGVFRHLDLRKGLIETSNTISELRGKDPIAGMLEVYGSCLLALFNTVGEAVHIKEQIGVSND